MTRQSAISDTETSAIAVTSRAPTEEATEVVIAPTSDYDDATIIASGDKVAIEGQGAKADDSTVDITAGGVYNLSGALRDGRM